MDILAKSTAISPEKYFLFSRNAGAEVIRPATPASTAPSRENRWYCLMFRARFRAAAAGSTSRELMTSRPTQVMDRVTTTAMATENTVSCQNT